MKERLRKSTIQIHRYKLAIKKKKKSDHKSNKYTTPSKKIDTNTKEKKREGLIDLYEKKILFSFFMFVENNLEENH
jgi:hypothetical protein